MFYDFYKFDIQCLYLWEYQLTFINFLHMIVKQVSLCVLPYFMQFGQP